MAYLALCTRGNVVFNNTLVNPIHKMKNAYYSLHMFNMSASVKSPYTSNQFMDVNRITKKNTYIDNNFELSST